MRLLQIACIGFAKSYPIPPRIHLQSAGRAEAGANSGDTFAVSRR